MVFDVNVVHTGSKGNSVIIDEKIVIDVGRSFKELEPYVLNADAIFITHRHVDHLNLAVINQLNIKAPWKISGNLYANNNVLEKIRTHKKLGFLTIPKKHILDSDMKFEIEANGRIYKIRTFNLEHDVPNQGFVIENDENEKLIYATDTSTMEYAPKEKYDYILLEGNYDEDKLADDMDIDVNLLRLIKESINEGLLPTLSNVDLSIDMIDDVYDNMLNLSDEENEIIDKLIKKASALVDRAERNTRHLSVQKFEDFVRKHAKKEAIIYQLHESEGFGLRSDLGIDF